MLANTLSSLLTLSFFILGKAQTKINPNPAFFSTSLRLLHTAGNVIGLCRMVTMLSTHFLAYSVEKSGCGSPAKMVVTICTWMRLPKKSGGQD